MTDDIHPIFASVYSPSGGVGKSTHAMRVAELNAAVAARGAAEGAVAVTYERHDSPLGPLLLAATANGLVRVGLPNESEDDFLSGIAARLSPAVVAAPTPATDVARVQLDEYFAGERQAFALPLDWTLTTGFRRQVLEHTALIPSGQTRTYTDVAADAGRPKAVRAAATALATNPLPLIIPCHRVLRTDGSLGGYRGGLDAKRKLLALEAS